jgi:hypothetical protein
MVPQAAAVNLGAKPANVDDATTNRGVERSDRCLLESPATTPSGDSLSDAIAL